MYTLSLEEKADALIALTIVFERRFPSRAETAAGRSLPDIVGESLRAISFSRREKLIKRASEVESLSDIQRQQWLGRWVDNVRRRGRSTKLDHHIDPGHIARVLKIEPVAIRRSILDYLPAELSHEVYRLLGTISTESPVTDGSLTEVPEEIVEVVKERFLANFVSVESLCETNALDELSTPQLRQLIRLLGLREIAIACRGIRSKEKIAAFLCRFAEEDAKAIATYLANLDHVEPIWVSIADRMVQRVWKRRLRPHQIVHKIGLELLACAFADRNGTAARYTAQKLLYRDSVRWERMVIAWKKRFDDPDTGMIEAERKRARMIVQFAREVKER